MHLDLDQFNIKYYLVVVIRRITTTTITSMSNTTVVIYEQPKHIKVSHFQCDTQQIGTEKISKNNIKILFCRNR